MLSEMNRLRKMKDFEILMKEGKMYTSSLVLAKIWFIDPTKYSRRGYSQEDLKIGFVVGLKISKKAVLRNRLKRQMREVARLLLKDGKLKTGFMVLFMAKKEMIDSEYKEIEKSVMDVLKKARILK